MDDKSWKVFLQTCRRILGRGAWESAISDSWCAFTTFSSIQDGVHYWNCGFPDEQELLDRETVDGGLWSQSFKYDDLAHIVVPKTFYWECYENDIFKSGTKVQNIDLLSSELQSLGIRHRKTHLVLEIKLY